MSFKLNLIYQKKRTLICEFKREFLFLESNFFEIRFLKIEFIDRFSLQTSRYY